jgi:hypothetical protein
VVNQVKGRQDSRLVNQVDNHVGNGSIVDNQLENQTGLNGLKLNSGPPSLLPARVYAQRTTKPDTNWATKCTTYDATEWAAK